MMQLVALGAMDAYLTKNDERIEKKNVKKLLDDVVIGDLSKIICGYVDGDKKYMYVDK